MFLNIKGNVSVCALSEDVFLNAVFVVGDRFITEKQILSFVVTFAGVSNYIHYPAHLSVSDSKTSISYSLILFSFYLYIYIIFNYIFYNI